MSATNIVNLGPLFPSQKQVLCRLKQLQADTECYTVYANDCIDLAVASSILSKTEAKYLRCILQRYTFITQGGLPFIDGMPTCFNCYTRFDHVIHGLAFLVNMYITESEMLDDSFSDSYCSSGSFEVERQKFHHYTAGSPRLFDMIRWLAHDYAHCAYSHLNPASESLETERYFQNTYILPPWIYLKREIADGKDLSATERLVGLDHLTYVAMDKFMFTGEYSFGSYQPETFESHLITNNVYALQTDYDALSKFYDTDAHITLKRELSLFSDSYDPSILDERNMLDDFPIMNYSTWGYGRLEARERKFVSHYRYRRSDRRELM